MAKHTYTAEYEGQTLSRVSKTPLPYFVLVKDPEEPEPVWSIGIPGRDLEQAEKELARIRTINPKLLTALVETTES